MPTSGLPHPALPILGHLCLGISLSPPLDRELVREGPGLVWSPLCPQYCPAQTRHGENTQGRFARLKRSSTQAHMQTPPQTASSPNTPANSRVDQRAPWHKLPHRDPRHPLPSSPDPGSNTFCLGCYVSHWEGHPYIPPFLGSLGLVLGSPFLNSPFPPS